MKTKTTTATVTDIAVAKKIDLARKVFAEITAPSYVAPEGSSPRAEFIKACVNDLKMTDSGASTYWQNLNTEAKGGKLYKHAKPATGAPRGRRADGSREIKKAAARVQVLSDRVQRTSAELADATAHFTQLQVGGNS